MTDFAHETVLRAETIDCLSPRAGGVYADVTLGGGGHAEAILDASAPDGRVIGLDRDERALDASRARLARFGDRARFHHSRFSGLVEVLRAEGTPHVDGILADLGVSSPQLDVAERGFSFSADGPLDMRMDSSAPRTARSLIEELSEAELADVLFEYGEERRSRPIARAIKTAARAGAMETTRDLRRAVTTVIRPGTERIDPATRTFQALRIAVNEELDELDALLKSAPDCLAPGGVLAIISFHSLEDRAVKYAFRDDARWEAITKKPLVATDEESQRNRRARSAKLRAAKLRHGGDVHRSEVA